MPLPELPHYPDVVSLIPNSGVQFLDFGFSLIDGDGRKNPKAPTDWGFYDPHPDTRTGAQELPILLRRGADDITPGREDYAIDVKRLLQFVGRTWLPIPLFREEPGRSFHHGPVNWSRAYLVQLPERDKAGNEYRLVVALDTGLMDEYADGGYLAPSSDDARNGRRFSLPGRTDFYNFLLCQPWLKGWLNELFKTMVEQEESRRANRREVTLSHEELVDRMSGPNEPLARYMAFVDLLYQLDFLPKLLFSDTVTAAKQVFVDVDMVLDLGNSRTCGLLVEAEPDSRGADINRAFRLELRDLSQPEQVYADPFDSRFEFAIARFGLNHHSHRSGRADAFSWSTIVRVGPEAVRMAGSRRGSEGRTGMSSPKRYLWDEEPSQQSWRFNGQTLDDEMEGFAAQGVFAGLVNDAGKPLHQVNPGEDDLPTLLARYSRSNLVSFALAEILLQALVMINAPAQRLRRRNADLPRRLRRLILTMPTALSLAERELLRARAEAARDLLYLCLGRAERQFGDEPGKLHWVEGPPPEIILKWDEASATQVVYLYSQIALAFSGDARAFIRAVRGGGSGQGEDGSSLRVATLDIGGGTTDLVITSLRADGQGSNVTIFPRQLFRESFSLAGDDIVQLLAREIAVTALSRTVQQSIGRERAEALTQELFGGNRGDMSAEEQLRRQQFAMQIAAPVAVALLGEYEGYDPIDPPPVEIRKLGDFFRPDAPPPPGLVQSLERTVAEAGATDFRLMEVPIPVDLADVDRIVRSLTGDMVRALTEVVWHYRADVMLLSGRPSRFPAIKDSILETGALPAHRVIAMHEFRVGQWYPFRNREARISDPKTTAAVGGMICLLAEGHLHNFNFRSDDLYARSVARFVGKVEAGNSNNRLQAQDVYLSDLDFETIEDLPEAKFEFRGPLLLGVRQFPNQWWPASLLYMIDFADEEARTRAMRRTPLRVQLKLESTKRPRGRPNEPQEKVVNDRLAIGEVEDSEGGALSGRQQPLRMRLQTLRNRDGYWLDTGILIDV
ncbi:virulence factor SrfB [Skermanella mucosa]|uniref:virulence factor SrfB n=1 Tax=Skermanella mucosa TaxID=1789672 RepID=UPI00192A7D0A|nr:virulence factor SrfB [Skermanella mucosa]UEM20655.1 virulence factor SrfB [Skermanella mucosa]